MAQSHTSGREVELGFEGEHPDTEEVLTLVHCKVNEGCPLSHGILGGHHMLVWLLNGIKIK